MFIDKRYIFKMGNVCSNGVRLKTEKTNVDVDDSLTFTGTVKQTDGKVETVAIKVLKENVNAEALEDFMGEIEIMTYFRHPNILKLIGIVPQCNVSQ